MAAVVPAPAPQSAERTLADLDTEVRDWLADADAEILGCRSGARHTGFDSFAADDMPNTTLEPDPSSRTGVCLLVQVCGDCRSVERWMVTGDNAEIMLPFGWHYRRLRSEYKAPDGHRVTSRMAMAELVRRRRESGKLAAMRAGTLLDMTAGRRYAAPDGTVVTVEAAGDGRLWLKARTPKGHLVGQVRTAAELMGIGIDPVSLAGLIPDSVPQ